jgi:hypothetical protein
MNRISFRQHRHPTRVVVSINSRGFDAGESDTLASGLVCYTLDYFIGQSQPTSLSKIPKKSVMVRLSSIFGVLGN